jgi:non-ribosomal peptide synthetase component F
LNACLVVAKNDRLIAYVQTRESDLTIEQHIQEICRQYLPSSITLFAVIVLDRFPLNANGKIDRARLPLPELNLSSLSINDKPKTEFEIELERFWCQLLKLDNIPRDVNLIRLGANSFHFMLATNYYCRQWLSDQPQIDLSIFFRETTLSQHAQFLSSHTKIISTNLSRCLPSHITEGISSFAQESIWLDEQIRFQLNNANENIYEMIYVFRVSSNLVVSRLRSSLELVIEKHSSLRSSLNMSHNELIQCIRPLNSIDEFLIESWIRNDDDLLKIIDDEETNRFHLDVSKGRVFRCHVIHYSDLQSNDILIFKFHHLIFDGTSETLFFNDLNEAYMTGKLTIIPNITLSYLDYARWERTLNMSNALLFWKENLKEYQTFELPYDRRLPTKARTGRGSKVILQNFDGNALFDYAARLGVTLFQLCLAIYYTFLFKLTGHRDLIVGGLVANRMQPEFESLIGMFVNLVPYRFKIESGETVEELIKRVQHLCHDVVSHAYVPFQSISKLIDLDNGISTTLDIETIQDQYSLDKNLQLIQMNLPLRVTQFDLSLSFKHNISKNTIECSFDYSTDVFDVSTIEILAKRFHRLIKQILNDDQQSVCKYNIILENEEQILRDLNPTNPIGRKTDCIHWAFARQAEEYPQKIGIIMEDQSLTYGEILHYTQQIASYLLKHCQVEVGDIICQLVERSIEMVLGIIAIWMCGAIYTPFSPREPTARLQSRISSLQAHLLLIHASTHHHKEEYSNITCIDLDQINNQTNDLSVLDNVNVTCEHLSHIVFTSGSTGEPKMVQLRHRNFVSYIGACLLECNDIIVQHASVAFDSHIEEIMGPLISGAQLALLKPDPYHLDLDYFTSSIARHQVTFIFPVPTLLIMFTNLLRSLPKDEQSNRLKTLRFLSCGGLSLILFRDNFILKIR